jgi:phosphoribosyl 1,2-cyclic phosphodiesterase
MPVQFAALASGSRGNSCLVAAGGAGLLIDLGLGPRSLAHRLANAGSGWGRIAAAVLTHTHGDHVGDATLRFLARRGVPLYCHEGHRDDLATHLGYRELEQRGLIRTFDDRPFLAPTGMRVEPVVLRHDSGPTFGFRVEGRGEGRRPVSVGYLADTGCWDDLMADALAEVDLLAVEFNHDVDMQRRSGRSPALIARILGDRGHLSNVQGAEFVSAVVERSRRGTVRHVVLLHLSEQCNRPELALMAARGALRQAGWRAAVHVARQSSVAPDLHVQPARRRAQGAASGEPTGFPWEAA